MDDSQPLSSAAAVQRVEANSAELVTAAVHNLYAMYPDLRDKHGPRGVQACYDDSIHHLNFLVAAVQNGTPSSYVDYVRWVTSVLQARHVADGLTALLELIGQQIRSVHGDSVWSWFQPTLDAA